MSKRKTAVPPSQHAAQRAIVHSALSILWRSLAVLVATEFMVSLILRVAGVEFTLSTFLLGIFLLAAIALPALHAVILRPVTSLAAQQAAAAAELRFRTVAQAIQDGVIVFGRERNIEFANAAAERMHGYAEGSLRGVLVEELMGEEVARSFRERFAALHAGEESAIAPEGAFESRGRRKDGEEFDVELSVNQVGNSEEAQFLAVLRDTTERKRMEEALRQSERQFRELLEALPVAVRLVQKGRVAYANVADALLFGYESPAEEFGGDAFAQVAGEDRERVKDFARRRVAGGDAPSRYEASLVRQNGEIFPAEITVKLVPYGEHPASLNVVRDLSEHRRLQMYERILPVCCVCGKIRDDAGAEPGAGTWGRLDHFVSRHSDAEISHTFCPECMTEYRQREGLPPR
jgi:PAS domain S-box-containing protein